MLEVVYTSDYVYVYMIYDICIFSFAYYASKSAHMNQLEAMYIYICILYLLCFYMCMYICIVSIVYTSVCNAYLTGLSDTLHASCAMYVAATSNLHPSHFG